MFTIYEFEEKIGVHRFMFMGYQMRFKVGLQDQDDHILPLRSEPQAAQQVDNHPLNPLRNQQNPPS